MHGDGHRQAQFQPHPDTGRRERRPDTGVHVHHIEVAPADRPLDRPGRHRVVGDLGRDRNPVPVHRHRERPAGHPARQRGGGDHLGLQAHFLLPPGQVVDLHLDATEPGDETVGNVRHPHRSTRLTTGNVSLESGSATC